MRSVLSYRIQEKAGPALSTSIKRYLEKVARYGIGIEGPTVDRPMEGALLLRDPVDASIIVCPWRIRKRGAETKLLLQAGGTASQSKPDPYMVRAIARAYIWNRQLVNGSFASGSEIVRAEGVTSRYIYKLLPLAFLAPDIVEAIS